ncbi:MAG: hypothetical protein ACTHN5_19105 [Phycisphaerae bacterium]
MLEAIRELLRKTPFKAFKIVTASGDKYEIDSPELVAIGQSQLSYFFPRSDRWVLIRLNQITAVESGGKAG